MYSFWQKVDQSNFYTSYMSAKKTTSFVILSTLWLKNVTHLTFAQDCSKVFYPYDEKIEEKFSPAFLVGDLIARDLNPTFLYEVSKTVLI